MIVSFKPGLELSACLDSLFLKGPIFGLVLLETGVDTCSLVLIIKSAASIDARFLHLSIDGNSRGNSLSSNSITLLEVEILSLGPSTMNGCSLALRIE